MNKLRIAAFVTSNRRGSLNRRLLDGIVDVLSSRDDVEVDEIDLRVLPLPLYDADLQDRDGVPAAAREIHDRVAASDALIVVNPEYNGGYPAIFKNVVDWASRVDMFVFHSRYTGLASATPGKGGGGRGLEHTQALFANIFVTTHDDLLTVPEAHESLGDEVLDADVAERIDAWVEGFVAAAFANRSEKQQAA